ncbi:hypothetical protein AMJ86_03295 [bacterium SM23_57]|jgi:epoxyqueuosine reductase|nr:MAG: hypothetical protein AMJ86_03295 [bacterium SM23_57]
MGSEYSKALTLQVLDKAIEFGASKAGIARVEDLKTSPSYGKYVENPYYSFFESLPDWPENAKSILVLALTHPSGNAEMDWWDPRPGGTPGNRTLIHIQNKMRFWLKDSLDFESKSLPYKIEDGGIFLKDSAVLAGIGIIGKNNLLITPEFGPKVRLRAMFLMPALEPSKPISFDPCSTCSVPCFRACPLNAFQSGAYERKYCQVQMAEDEENIQPHPDNPEINHVRYCRNCELVCPVGK